jgi:hypothetical protein
MQFGELNNLLDMAKEEMKKVMLINDVKLQYDDSMFSDYFTLKVMVLVNRGIYCRNNRTPESLKSILLEVVNNPSEKMKTELINSLNTLWHPFLAVRFIEDVVEILTTRHLYKNRSTITQTEVENAVSSFFLLADHNTITQISHKVLNKMENFLA